MSLEIDSLDGIALHDYVALTAPSIRPLPIRVVLIIHNGKDSSMLTFNTGKMVITNFLVSSNSRCKTRSCKTRNTDNGIQNIVLKQNNWVKSKLFGNFLGGNVKTIKSNNIQSKASNVKCKIRSYKTPKVFQFVMCHTKSSEISIFNFFVKFLGQESS